LALTLAAGEDAPDDPQIETMALYNGPEIIVIPNCCADVVAHMLWYRGSSAHEPKGKSGIALD